MDHEKKIPRLEGTKKVREPERHSIRTRPRQRGRVPFVLVVLFVTETNLVRVSQLLINNS